MSDDANKPVPSPGTVLMHERCNICFFPRATNGVLTHDGWCFKKNQEYAINGPVMQLLLAAFAYGASDAEACVYANIGEITLRRYKIAHPDFAEHVQSLKMSPVLRARKSVIDKLDADGDLAMKFLERKKKDEFSPRTEVTGRDGADLPAPILSNVINVEAKPDEPKGILGELPPA